VRSLFVAAPTIRTGSVGTYENKARFKLGPFITTSEFFRRRHILLRVKDKEGSERHGTTGVALKGCVGSDKAQSFEERLTHRTYYRGQVSGEVLVRVAGGQEEGDNTLDEDSVVSTVSHTHTHTHTHTHLPPCTRAVWPLVCSASRVYLRRRLSVRSLPSPALTAPPPNRTTNK
jgi:hypothetical protein